MKQLQQKERLRPLLLIGNGKKENVHVSTCNVQLHFQDDIYWEVGIAHKYDCSKV